MTTTTIKRLVVSTLAGSLMALGGVALSPPSASAQTETHAQTEHQRMSGQKGAKQIESVSTTARIVKIDKKKGEVTLQAPRGEKVKVQVPEKHRADMSELKKGDTVRVDYIEALALQVARPGDRASGGVTVKEVEKRLPKGAVAGSEVSTTVEVAKVDTKKNELTVKGPRGMKQTIQVFDPTMQQRLGELKKGDKVQIRYTEAVAVRLQSTGPSRG